MDEKKEIFLSDTNMKLGSLKNKLSEVYGLDIISKNQKRIYVGIILALTGIVLYQYLKK